MNEAYIKTPEYRRSIYVYEAVEAFRELSNHPINTKWFEDRDKIEAFITEHKISKQVNDNLTYITCGLEAIRNLKHSYLSVFKYNFETQLDKYLVEMF